MYIYFYGEKKQPIGKLIKQSVEKKQGLDAMMERQMALFT